MLRSHLIVALSTTLALWAGAASAAGFDEPVSVAVRTDNLDLHTPAGAQLMALRIRNAASVACGGQVYPLAVRISEGFIRCRETAVDRAVRDLHAPLVADALGRSPVMLSQGQ